MPGERGGEEFIFIGRGTGTFNVLAGTDVCSVSPDDGPAVDGPPKGLPGDASQVVLDDAETSEAGHCFYDASWHTLSTMLAYPWRDPEVVEANRRMSAIGAPDDVRCVFWFGS